MLLEHRVITQESPSVPRQLVYGAVAGFALPILLGILTFAHLLPGSMGEGVLWLTAAAGVGLYVVGWRLPLKYLLTDTHLRVARGLFNGRWVPLDQIDLICQTSRNDELIYSGFTALAGDGEPVIINPHQSPEFRIAFTPGDEFLRTLFWATNRSGFDPLPARSGPVDEEH